MPVEVLLELVVDQDHAFAGDVHGDVAAVAFDLVEIVFDLVESQLRRRALVLRVSDPATKQKQDASGSACEKCSAHARTLYQMFRRVRPLLRMQRGERRNPGGAPGRSVGRAHRHRE